MGKSQTVVKTQYLYLNSANRRESDSAHKFTVRIPSGMFLCDSPGQHFKLSVQDFSMVASWYYVNSTNNTFHAYYTSTLFKTITIPQGNYTFKALAYATQTAIQAFQELAAVTVTWDSIKNRLVFTFPSSSFGLDFASVNNSAHDILGFDKAQYFGATLTGLYPLKTTLSKNICIYIDNLTPDKDFTSVENTKSDVCVPSTSMMSIVNNFAPNDIINFVNPTGDLFALYVKEKGIEQVDFSVRDENAELMTYVTDWRASIKVETLQDDDTYQQQVDSLNALSEMKEYLKYIFVGNHLGKA